MDVNQTDENGNTVAHYAAQLYQGKAILLYLDELYSAKAKKKNEFC